MLTEVERTVLSNWLAKEDALREAFRKFCAYQKALHDRFCADEMRSVPRQFEKAADHAAKADVYSTMFTDLDHFLIHELEAVHGKK